MFLKSQWFFLDCSSLAYIILRFFLQSYKITAFVNLYLIPLKCQKVKKQQ